MQIHIVISILPHGYRIHVFYRDPHGIEGIRVNARSFDLALLTVPAVKAWLREMIAETIVIAFLTLLGAGVLTLLSLAWNKRIARRQLHVLGPSRYRECAAITRRVGRLSDRIDAVTKLRLAVLAFAVGLLIIGLGRGFTLTLSLTALVTLAVGLVMWGIQRVPASILVLGSSSTDSLSLQAAVKSAASPFRPVSLLAASPLRLPVRLQGDSFRILGVWDDADWREAVFAFANAAALIVLDVRNLTPQVEEEFRHVVSHGYAYKTLFIGSDEAMARLENAGPPPSSTMTDLGGLLLPSTEEGVRLIAYLFVRARGCSDPGELNSLDVHGMAAMVGDRDTGSSKRSTGRPA